MKTLNEQLEIAIELAIKYHKGQIDKGGNPYILHPLEVMNNVDRMESKIVAVLHDIIEDTECTVDTLREWGIDEDAERICQDLISQIERHSPEWKDVGEIIKSLCFDWNLYEFDLFNGILKYSKI